MNRRELNIAHDNTMYEINKRVKDKEYELFKSLIEQAKAHFTNRNTLKILSADTAVRGADGNTELHLTEHEMTPIAIIGAFQTILDMIAGNKKEEKIMRARHKIRQQNFF